MLKKTLKPWHEVVELKEEVRSGSLSLDEFAADLHEVMLESGRRPVYEDPRKFFALTYATLALRNLVRDLAERLAGASDKAIRQLELTYGGGKTHTLITLYHLFRNPDALPDLPAIQEFRQHSGRNFPPAHVVALCFDKIDAELGIKSVRAPDGSTRGLRHPWSILAFQLAGAEGLCHIHAENKDEERETPPAEPLWVDLLEKPQERGLSTLILMDEVLMYAREKAKVDAGWRERIQDFFQYLTQAVVKVDRAALVASILATNPKQEQGELGQSLVADLGDVFRRQREEGVQPVQKDDVAEVLRRRFFVPESIREPESYRPHVIGVVEGLAGVDEEMRRGRREAEDRFLKNFPFHPDLTEVFFSCWTQLQGFQRTRGLLRTLTIAFRNAEKWDASPVVGPATLLAEPGNTGVSESIRELAGIATSENTDAGRPDWSALLEAELKKAAQVQTDVPALEPHREAEQAVVAVFLHSQPIGHKAQTGELLRMIGSAAPDLIELNKGLQRWREISWFLDDEDVQAEDAGGAPPLPKAWCLGNRPNLKQMHDQACRLRVTEDQVKEELEQQIRKLKRHLSDGASAMGARTHLLPDSPRDVEDDGNFHYAVLGPGAVSESGKPSALARSFIDDTGGQDRRRVHRNALVLAVPSRNGLDAAIGSVRALLGWQDVREQLSQHKVDPAQWERLNRAMHKAEQRVADVVRQAYEIVVTTSEDDTVQAFKLNVGSESLFIAIKNCDSARIQETQVDAAALLPDGPYDLWLGSDESRFVRDLSEAFARYPRLPKVLNPKIVYDTVLQGVARGLFVARLTRPDGSIRTWWREEVGDEVRDELTLEVVLPGRAKLVSFPSDLLAVGKLPALWPETPEKGLKLKDLLTYFKGGRTVLVPKEDYEEPHVIPHCPREILWAAVARATEAGTVWLTDGPMSVWKEAVPQNVLNETAVLRPAPVLIAPQKLVPNALPAAWKDEKTNGAKLARALSQDQGIELPWGLIRESIKQAVEARWLEVAEDSTVSFSCSYDEVSNLWLRLPVHEPSRPVAPTARVAVLECRQIQDLAERVPELLAGGAGSELVFHVRPELRGDWADHVRDEVNRVLKTVADDLEAE